MKLFGITFKFINRTFFQDLTWGMVACLLGMMVTVFVVSISHYYSEWFVAIFSFVFTVVILIRFEKNWDNLWNKKKKKKYIKVDDLKI